MANAKISTGKEKRNYNVEKYDKVECIYEKLQCRKIQG
jgi:hypothetical protein